MLKDRVIPNLLQHKPYLMKDWDYIPSARTVTKCQNLTWRCYARLLGAMGTCHCLHISFSLLIWQIVKQSETRMHRTLIVRRASCLGSNGHEQAWLWAFNVHFSKQIRKDLRCCWTCKENENVMKLLLFEVWRWQRKALFEWNFFPHKRKLDVCVRAQLAPLSATNRI